MKPIDVPGGLLVVVEGIDGAGKTTLANLLADWLHGVGAKVSVSKEPTRGPWGMKLRESAAAGRLTPDDERRFLILDRKQHVDELIRPALVRNEIVILDRYYLSMLAYQGAAGLDLDDLKAANDFAPEPDVLLLLDLSPEDGLARIRARGDEPNHFETVETLSAARQIFRDLDDGKVLIDATQAIAQVVAQAQLAVLKAITDKLSAERPRDPTVAIDVSHYMPSMAK